MSKRSGDYITVEDLIKEVGKDATRFIMLNRSNDADIDFDFTNVKEKSKENPLYYVQYCYARISSVFRNINKNVSDNFNITKYDFNYLLIKDDVFTIRRSRVIEFCKTLKKTASESSSKLRVSAIAKGFRPVITDIIMVPVSQRSVSSQIW